MLCASGDSFLFEVPCARREDDLAISGAAALAKFGRVYQKQIASKQADSDSEWEGEPQRRRKKARGQSTRPGRDRGRKGMANTFPVISTSSAAAPEKAGVGKVRGKPLG